MKLFSKEHPAGRQPRQYRALYVLLSFLIPFLVITLAVAALHIIPLGDKHSLAISDGKWYLNNLAFLKRLLSGQENFLYSLKNGLGGNEWSILAWGGFNPVLLLCMFAKLETLPSWFTWISIVNMAVCGLTMYIMLAGIYGHKSSHLIFSTSYAMIGFSVANCYQTLFFIGPQTLPLMILGIMWLCKGKSPLLYILSLAYCSLFNFYFGFMLCVASVVFFLVKLYTDDSLSGKRGRVFGKWTASSAISGLLAAPMWLPALKAYSGGGRLNQTTLEEYTFTEQAPFIQIFSKLFSGANSLNETVFGLPNIFCGILTVALVILFFMNLHIPKRKKTAAGVVLGFYLLTFYLPAFSNIMHGFTVTNWFPYRYSFVFSFWLLFIAAEQFEYIDIISFADLKRCGATLLIATILIFSTKYEFISGGAVVLDLALLGLMSLGFWLYRAKPNHTPKRVLVMFLLLVVSGNLYANYVLSITALQEWELDLNAYQENLFTNGVLIEALTKAEPSFFRMEKESSDSERVGADAYLYNYHGVSHSGPAERHFIHNELSRLGISRFDMCHWYSEGIPASTDALLGLKYLIAESDLTEIKGYEKRITWEGKSIYQSNDFLFPTILTDDDACALSLGNNTFNNLNDIWKNMTGNTADIFTHQPDVTFRMHSDYTEQTVTSAELQENISRIYANVKKDKSNKTEVESSTYIEYTLTSPADGALYYFDTSIPDSEVGLLDPAIHLCGVYKAGEVVSGKIPLQTKLSNGELLRGYCANLVFATENLDVLAEYAKQLNARECTFNVIQDNHLTGDFTAEANQRILFTLPWDEGWTCTVDGQKVPIDKTWDLFMSVEVPEGKHSYEMKFIPAWLNYGLYLSAAALVGLVILMANHHMQSKRRRRSALLP